MRELGDIRGSGQSEDSPLKKVRKQRKVIRGARAIQGGFLEEDAKDSWDLISSSHKDKHVGSAHQIFAQQFITD